MANAAAGFFTRPAAGDANISIWNYTSGRGASQRERCILTPSGGRGMIRSHMTVWTSPRLVRDLVAMSLVGLGVFVVLGGSMRVQRPAVRFTPERFTSLRVGMTHAQVAALLGPPRVRGRQMKVEAPAGLKNRILGWFVIKYVWDSLYERWIYGTIERGCARWPIPETPKQGYVVYFNESGKVVKWRAPVHLAPSRRVIR